MKTKLTRRFWCALTLFSLTGQVAWIVENMYFNVFLYKMFSASAGDISAMVSASAAAATVTTIFMGALSDRLGKRKAFICVGYVLWGISIFSFMLMRRDVLSALFPAAANVAALGVTLTIVLDCVMTFFGSTANDAAFNAWLTDSTDDSNRGAAEGINAMMPLLAILVVFGGFMAFDLNQEDSWTWIFAIIGVVVTAVGLGGMHLLQDPPIRPTDTGYLENILHSFRPSTIGRHPMLYLTLAVYLVFNIAIQVFMPYLIIYYEVSLGMTDYVLIFAPAIIVASVVTAIWGRVYDSKGFPFAVLTALGSLCVGLAGLYFLRDRLGVFVASLAMMCGYLAAGAVFSAKLRSHIPQGQAGMFQGVRIVGQVLLPGIIGPGLGAWVLRNAKTMVNGDGTTSFIPSADIFLAALVVTLLVLALLPVVIKKRK